MEKGFLSLGLKKFTTIKIGDDIEITLRRIGKNFVYVDISAPREINITRHDDYYDAYAQSARKSYEDRKKRNKELFSMASFNDDENFNL